MATTTQPGLLSPQHLDGRVFSDGWAAAAERIVVRDAATAETLAEAGGADLAAIRRAAASAAAAQPAWAALDPHERGAILLAAAAAFDRHRDEIADWLVREAGSVPAKAAVELRGSIGELREAAALAPRMRGEALADPDGRLHLALRAPLGVVGVITPWNFPLLLAIRSLAPALALGNAVVLKPDANTAVCGGLVIARIFEEAGLPAGVLHVLPGGPEAGQAVCEAPEVAMVSFTGSTAAGRKVGATCGHNLKKVALELGGKNAFIVLDDADVDGASSAGAWGSFLHQGQICMAAGRHLVHERVAERYLEALAERARRLPFGNPATEQVALGPIINERQLSRIGELVDDTRAAGATIVAGGVAERPFFPPTVIGGVTPAMRIWREEIFGPVAAITTFADDEEAIALANDGDYGLSVGVYTADASRGRAIVAGVRAGMAHIGDQPVADDPRMPFGGFGASGNGGSFGGEANLAEFSQWRWLTERATPATYPF